MLKFFFQAFANAGDKTAVPNAVDVNGNVSYSQGYGFDYQRQKTDPAAKNIERDKMNQILFDITNAIAELQSQGIPDFITSALNGGTAYSYAQYAVVRYSGANYISLVGTNTADPTDATKWALLPTPALIQQAAYMSATAGGTVDAITAAFSPAIASLPAAPSTLAVLVRAAGANTSTTPTFAPDGLAAKTIVKGNNLALAAGDIAGAGHWILLQYDATLDKWVLMNPANGIALPSTLATKTGVQNGSYSTAVAAGTVDALTATFSPAFTAYTTGMIVGLRVSGANTVTNPTFAPDGLAAKTIVKGSNLPLVAGDIPGASAWIWLEYSSNNDLWNLLNPATGISVPANIQKGTHNTAIVAGTSTLTAAFSPPIAAVSNGMILYVRAVGANTITAPTFAPDGLPAKQIVKGHNQLLAIGDIPGAGAWLALQYTSNGDYWVLLNPALGVTPPTIASTAEAQAGTNNTNFITPLRLREGLNAAGSAPVYAARAWANWQGTGTVTLNAGGNVSSIGDNGTGRYVMNFTTAMPDANYSTVVSATATASGNANMVGEYTTTQGGAPANKTVSAVEVAISTTGGVIDYASVNAAIFR